MYRSSPLKKEALARELVNRVQGLRKEAGLNLVDRIELERVAEKNLKSSFETYKDYI